MSDREDADEADVVEERVYTIPLKKAWIAPIKKRVPRGVRMVRAFVQKHMKVEDPVITPEVNEYLWKRGIEGLPRRVRVRITRDGDGVVTVHLVTGE
jgi:large subunit ribosomal protein L31e